MTEWDKVLGPSLANIPKKSLFKIKNYISFKFFHFKTRAFLQEIRNCKELNEAVGKEV